MGKKLGITLGLVAAAVIALVLFIILQNRAEAPDSDITEDSNNSQNRNREDDSRADLNNEDDVEVQSGEVSVDIANSTYRQADITVKKGTTVTWTNQDAMQHDVVSDDTSDGGPQSELLSLGESYSFTFDTVGEFSYHCTPHPFMKGKVTVVE